MKLDTLTLVETPEGIDLQAELAGLVPRALAYSIDFSIRIAILFAMGIALTFLGKSGSGLFLILFFIAEWWYPVFFEVFRGGQTPGKKSFNIKVINDDLTPVTFSASLTRNLLRTADLLPMFYVFGAISMSSSAKFQRLGDLAAGTLVIYKKEKEHNLSSLSEIMAVAPAHPLSEDLQVAFVSFSLNRGGISTDRQEEIAEIIRPRIPLKVDKASDYVNGVGKWLLGARQTTNDVETK